MTDPKRITGAQARALREADAASAAEWGVDPDARFAALALAVEELEAERDAANARAERAERALVETVGVLNGDWSSAHVRQHPEAAPLTAARAADAWAAIASKERARADAAESEVRCLRVALRTPRCVKRPETCGMPDCAGALCADCPPEAWAALSPEEGA